jgi:hypothetical protein
VVGSVSFDPREWSIARYRRRWRHPRVRGDLCGRSAFTTTSATPCRRHPTGSNPSTGVSQTATSTRGPGAGASMPPCSCGCQPGAPAQHRRHHLRSAPAHLRALRRRSGTSPARTSQEGTSGQGIPAQGVHGHPGRRRSHAPILDADPLRLRRARLPTEATWLIELVSVRASRRADFHHGIPQIARCAALCMQARTDGLLDLRAFVQYCYLSPWR